MNKLNLTGCNSKHLQIFYQLTNDFMAQNLLTMLNLNIFATYGVFHCEKLGKISLTIIYEKSQNIQ